MSFSRFRKIIDVYVIIHLFFKRKVMGWGILKSKFFRLSIGATLLALISGLTILLYQFWENTGSTPKQIRVILDVYSLTVIMWTLCCFLFIKVLFMKTDRFMEFTYQFPITKREGKAALLIFELYISLLVILIISSAVVISLVAKYGTMFIERIICNVIYTPITVFVLLELIYVCAEFFLESFGIIRMKGVVLFCLNSMVLMIMYFAGYDKLLDAMLFDYLEDKGTNIIALYSFLAEKTNFIVTTLLFCCILSVLIIAILLVPIAISSTPNKYIKLGQVKREVGLFGTYFLNLTRDIDTLNYSIIAYFIFIMAILLRVQYGVFSILILSINCLYAYTHTDSLRNLLYQKNYSSIIDYFAMVGSHVLYSIILSAPMIVINALLFSNYKECFLLYPLIVFSDAMFIMVGILFPPKKDNPFSACVGIGLIFILGIVLVLACGLMELSNEMQTAVFVVVFCFSVLLSQIGMKKIQRMERHEKSC